MPDGPPSPVDNLTFLCRTVVLLVFFHTLSVLVTATNKPTQVRSYDTRINTFTLSTQSDLLITNTVPSIQSDVPIPTNVPSTQSGLFTLASGSATSLCCQITEETLTNRTGAIIITNTAEWYFKERVWNIHLPSPEEGIVIKFKYIHVQGKWSDVFIRDSMSRTVRILRENYLGNLDLTPVLFRDNKVKITIDKRQHYSEKRYDVLNLLYAAHPVGKMPRVITDQDFEYKYYNCSGDMLVPFAFKCNMVQECVGNEDENQCEHVDKDCGDWLPLRKNCLKLMLESRLPFTFYDADNICFFRFGARLAKLIDMDDVGFVGHTMEYTLFHSIGVGIGAKRMVPFTKGMSQLYRFMWQWGDRGSPIIYQHIGGNNKHERKCASIDRRGKAIILIAVYCDQSPQGFACMNPKPAYKYVQINTRLYVNLPRPNHTISQFPTRQCQDGSLVQLFHFCHHETRQEAMTGSSHSAVLFACRYGPPVHYTLVCDGNADCQDVSDETFCGPIRFEFLKIVTFKCGQFQLIPKSKRCDAKQDCFDGSDEVGCTKCADGVKFCQHSGCQQSRYVEYVNDYCFINIIPDYPDLDCHNCSLVVSMDGYGTAFLQPASETNLEGTIPCSEDYSIPSYLFNNGEYDCKYGEDEAIPVKNVVCPDYYRCQYSYSCVHPDHVCDGIHHCPNKDDERYCDLLCPEGCRCEGYVFSCIYVSNFLPLLQARSLNLSGSMNVSLPSLEPLDLLQFLTLSNCGLKTVILMDMPNLQKLDLSFNNLRHLSSIVISGFQNLIYLDLSGNSLARVLGSLFAIYIRQSDLSSLQTLIMRNIELHSLEDRPFSQLTELAVLDIMDNSISSYDKHVFLGLDSLQQLYTDDYKLCCPFFHNSFTVDCIAHSDELSSCSDLLRQSIFRVFLWLIALLSILGNISVGLYRLFQGETGTVYAYRVLVSNLCAADLSMGVYMVMIGTADALFHGQYVAMEKAWKTSVMCKAAGFLGFVSSEASALTICLITLDRVLVLCFPLKVHLHLRSHSSLAACGVVWFVAVTLAALPLLAELEFYGVNSICLPLPITRHQYSGRFHSFAVFIVFNFAMFILIGLGQGIIYHAIVRASKAAGTGRQSQEMTIARRLFLVIVSDFCCWFPIGLMGILVVSGLPIPVFVNVWAAVFVLPLNSALNPFLYTLNTFREKWRAERLKKESLKILANMKNHVPRMQPSAAEDLVRFCIRSNVVSREIILQILKVQRDSLMNSPVSED